MKKYLTSALVMGLNLHMFFSGKDTIGLDIGSSYLKVVQLKEKRGGYELDAFDMLPLPPELIVEGSIIDSLRLVDSIKDQFRREGVLQDVEFHPNLDRQAKLEFMSSLTVFSAPAMYGEAFGLYVIEALAAGVPVVQPRHAAFPELIEATGGGLVFDPDDPAALADAVEGLVKDPNRARQLGRTGQSRVQSEFSVRRMAEKVLEVFDEVIEKSGGKG